MVARRLIPAGRVTVILNKSVTLKMQDANGVMRMKRFPRGEQSISAKFSSHWAVRAATRQPPK